MEFSAELGSDKTVIASFDRRIRKGGSLGRWYGRRRGFNAMDWFMRPAETSPIPADVEAELQSGRVTTLIVNHIYAIQFGQKLKLRLKELGQVVPMIFVTHDVQSHILLDNGINNPFSRRPDSFDELFSTEIIALRAADVLVHVSIDDKRLFEDALPDKPHILVLPTCEDLSHIAHPFPPGSTKDLLFVGANNIANYQAIEWFFSRVKPWLGAAPLSASIVGSVSEMVQNRNPELYDRIKPHLIGSVAETLPYYLMCTCVVIPMIGGRGVSIKTVEAAALGRPIVGTRFAYRGLPIEAVEAAGIRICDDPREFALEVFNTLDDPEPRRLASRTLFKQLFTYDRFENAMNEALVASGTLCRS
jgi:glycosyltransferase involved in cell wall biosynthesis